MMSSRPAGVSGFNERDVNGLAVVAVAGVEGSIDGPGEEDRTAKGAVSAARGGDLIRIGSMVTGRSVSNAALGWFVGVEARSPPDVPGGDMVELVIAAV